MKLQVLINASVYKTKMNVMKDRQTGQEINWYQIVLDQNDDVETFTCSEDVYINARRGQEYTLIGEYDSQNKRFKVVGIEPEAPEVSETPETPETPEATDVPETPETPASADAPPVDAGTSDTDTAAPATATDNQPDADAQPEASDTDTQPETSDTDNQSDTDKPAKKGRR